MASGEPQDGDEPPSPAPRRDPAEFRSARDLTRAQTRSFALIVAIFVGLLLVSLAASWAAIDVVNSTRAYATGEGRYSKAQKIAVLNLYRYAYSRDPQHYQAFVDATKIPLGDRFARQALERSPQDLDAAASGFLQGDNHPDDIDGLIRLFRWFSWWAPFAAAVEDWREGDLLVAELADRGARLAEHVAAGRLDERTRAELLAAIDRTDHRLTELENTFSTHMGEAARAATTLVILGLCATTVLLWTIGIGFASRLFRAQLALDRELASSRQRFRDYAEVASDWYWETDADLRLTYLSERFPEVTGMSAEGALGHSLVDFARTHADGHDQGEALAALAGRQPFRGLHLRAQREDGSVSFWSLAGKPCTDADGTFQGFRGAGSDITSAVFDAEGLMDAKARAEEANRAKSDFLANMSHELRTPLNAILGFSEIIATRMLGPDAIDRYVGYAENIHGSGKHLLAIIDDVLDLSKVEAGRAELVESEIGLDDLFDAVRALLGDRFEAVGLSFEVQKPTPEPWLRVDERKLKQCLVNLLSNALKFTPPSGRVTLSAAAEPTGGLSILVSDTGIGIAPHEMARVMAPFGQIESTFTRRHHGTGLGLTLVRLLIELHGGSMHLDSTPGVGTTVTLSIPPQRVSPRTQRATASAGG